MTQTETPKLHSGAKQGLPGPQPGGKPAKLTKVLFVRFSAYGDILMCLPALVSFRRAFPESEVHFLVVTEYADMLRSLKGVCYDRLITYRRSPGLFGVAETIAMAARLSAQR